CDCPRRFYDVATHYDLFPFTHIVYVPRKRHEGAHEIYKQEIKKFIKAFEEHFKVTVTDEALMKSIEVYEKTRELFRKLYELRKSDAPPITGAEVIDVYNAMQMMPREQFNPLLEKLVHEAGTAKRHFDGRVRLMINGSPLNNAEFVQVIEKEGGIIVVEELCTTTRYWWNSVKVNPGENPLDALCRRYLNNEPCARMKPSEERWESALARAKDWRVDGIVSQTIRYCAAYGNDQPMLRKKLEGEGLPVLELDVEYGMAGLGQVKTRVQAFLEMIKGRQQ
ncbi:MAG: 2-hydroxyacyl-CoA dehydratase family protein, partial [Dehalococcoidia bacterium]